MGKKSIGFGLVGVFQAISWVFTRDEEARQGGVFVRGFAGVWSPVGKV